jgi:UDP-GlcNAc:undecaprenyl-phosphate/decaprenyl-phosphate GlcNAc-1-phosphate transferase
MPDSFRYSTLVAAAAGFVVALVLTPLVRRTALRFGIVARPGGRRVHARPTPLLGGIAMYVGFVAASMLTAKAYPEIGLGRQAYGILCGATLMAIVGILDDKFELPGWVQALSILCAGGILAAFGVQIRYVTNPFATGQLIWFGLFSIPLTMLWVLMVTKAVDCMDGLDGLAAGISAIAAGTLMLMSLRFGGGYQMSAVMAAAVMGAAIGFLRYNYPPAKIFMGTVGAQFLGFTLAGLAIAGAFKVAALVAIAAPVLVLGVPLFDTTFVVLRRAASGRKVSEADKSHLHHRLLDKGYTHRQVIWFIYALTFVFCGVGYALFTWVR